MTFHTIPLFFQLTLNCDMSQLSRYARDCSSCECFILIAMRLSSKLLKQWYPMERLKSSFRKFYGRHGDLIQQYEVSLSPMLNDILTLDKLQWLPNRSDFPPISWPWYRTWPWPNYEWFPWSICNGCDMSAGNTYPSRLLPPPPFLGGGDLLTLQLLSPVFPNLSCIFSTSLLFPLYFLNLALSTFQNLKPWSKLMSHER